MILNSITEVVVLGTAKKQLNQEQQDWCASFKISLAKSEQAILQAVYLDAEMTTVGEVLETEEIGTEVEKNLVQENEIEESYTMYIETMLEEFPQLVHQYIEMATESGKVLPRRFIPKYLNYIKNWDTTSRQQASLIAGERAKYLSKFFKQWNFLVPTSINWETAFHKQRVAHAKKVRENNPKEALALIEKGFKENHSTERKELLEILSVNLSETDVPFLKENLEDRSKAVKQVAYNLLTIIDKQTQTELFEVASFYIKIKKGGFLSKGSLEVALPEATTFINNLASAERNGVQVGKKAEKLLNLVSILPFSFYELEPSKILDFIAKSEWNKVLLQGFQNAAILHQNTKWAMELIPALEKNKMAIDANLLKALSEDEFNKVIENQLAANSRQFKYNEILGKLFRTSNQAINVKNSKKLLSQLAKYYEANTAGNKRLYAEDIKIIKSILARMDWEIKTVPDELNDFDDLFITKQKLKDSLK